MMELRRAAERRLPQLLLQLPVACVSRASATSFTHQNPVLGRSFSITHSLGDNQDPSPKGRPSSSYPSSSQKDASSAPKQASTSSADLDSLLASHLNFARGDQPRAAPSPPLNRNPNTNQSSETSSRPSIAASLLQPRQSQQKKQAMSVQELLKRINEESPRNGSDTASRRQRDDAEGDRLGLGTTGNRAPSLTFETSNNSNPQAIASAVLRSMSSDPADMARLTAAAMTAPPLRLNPSLGRTVKVDANRNIDLGRAFRQLDGTLARNKVRSDVFRQRFHERPGLKRKRLASERWRRRFKESFQGVVRRVEELRRQGW